MNLIQKTKQTLAKLRFTSRHVDERGLLAGMIRILFHIYRFTRITIREFIEDNLLVRGMALAFVTLLSLVPLMVILLSIFKLFDGDQWFMEILRPILLKNLAPGSGPVLAEKIEAVLVVNGGTTEGVIGLLFLILMVHTIFSAIESAFNQIWGVTTPSGRLNRLPLYWGLLIIIPVLVGSSFAFTTYIKALPLIHEAVERASYLGSILNRALPMIMIMLGFFLLYKFIPGTRVRNSAAIAGTIVAGLMYELFKSGFLVYTTKLVNYDILYGSLAILPLLMIWVNLSWIVVLAGVEVSFVTQHYNVLLTKRKNIVFSRPQNDALAYIILTQISLAFRGQRPAVTLDEWSHRSGAPPGIVQKVVSKLESSGLIARSGNGASQLLLNRDPDYVPIEDIDRILSGEAAEEWVWPEDENWNYLREWLKSKRKENCDGRKMTLGDLVDLLGTERTDSDNCEEGE